MTETILFIIIFVYMIVQLGMTIWAMRKMNNIMKRIEK